METVDRWLKSLRLHKYTHLFKSLTYEEMLNIQEKFLIDMDITKGARNKILVSIKKLNLRQDRLVYMIDDLNQGNISMKEALTVLKEMLITPIPRPYATQNDHAPSPTLSLTESVSSGISVGSSIISHDNSSTDGSSNINININHHNHSYPIRATPPLSTTTATRATPAISNYTQPHDNNNSSACDLSSKASDSPIHYYDPYDLTYLFVDTFERVAQRLIESVGFEDNACHGIMAAIVDECLKHNSFTDEQKARVACFNQPILREQHQHQQKVRMARFNQPAGATAREQQQQKGKVARYKQLIIREQKARMFRQPPPPPLMRQFYQQSNSGLPISSAISTAGIGADERHQPYPYKEYSLLGPGLTFELPCLRAKAEADNKHNRNHLSLF